MAKKAPKKQSLTIRLDDKTRFMLEYIGRITGQSFTTIIERAIKKTADETIIPGQDFHSNWANYWAPEEGMRFLKLLCDDRVRGNYTEYEEDAIFDFMLKHKEFFLLVTKHYGQYGSFEGESYEPNSSFLDVLWPNIHEYYEHWCTNKASDRWATGRLMVNDIQAAKQTPPTWPPVNSKDPDDEIPF